MTEEHGSEGDPSPPPAPPAAPSEPVDPGAEPAPAEAADTARAYHPVTLVAYGTRRRSRLTVLFRLVLATPHMYWLTLWAAGAALVAFVAWWAALFTGRVPRKLHGFLARFVRYETHVLAYLHLLANPYPHFVGDPGDYPVDLEIAPAVRQSRLKVAFRLVLAIPAFVLSTVFYYLLELISVLGWFVCIAVGRMPDGMQNLGLFCLRYQQQTHAYLALLTDRYPPLASPPSPTGEWRKPVPGWQRDAIAAGWLPPPGHPLATPAPAADPRPTTSEG